ncbi:MAG: rhodanese-like domain-containing protein [Nitrospira sp.]|nr:rhodanese-like domain-containing protein [Nitrospira sp.]
MKRTVVKLLGCLLVVIFVIGDFAYGYHSYLLTVQQLHSALSKGFSKEEKGFILVDVRTPEEHRAGMIPGTDLNIDFREIKTRHREIGAQLDDHIVVYCQSGRRSNIAAETLADLGYRHVYNVEGSMNAWVESGFPVEHPKR